MAKEKAAKDGDRVKLSFIRFGMTKLPSVGVGGMTRRITCIKKKASYIVEDTEDLKGLFGAIRNIKESDLNRVNSGILKDNVDHIIRQGYCLPEDEKMFASKVRAEAIKEWESMRDAFNEVDAKWTEYKKNM